MARPLAIIPGISHTPGAQHDADGAHFSLFSAHADKVELCLFSTDGKTETARLPLPGRTGDLWHGFVPGLTAGQLYAYRVHGPYAPHEGHRFNANKLLLDPYARLLKGNFILDDALFGFDRKAPDADLSFDTRNSAPFMPKCVLAGPDLPYDANPGPATPWSDTVIYEAHVRGMTMLHPDVPEKLRGTISGLSHPKMLDHLTRLGITAIELLPVHQAFPEPRLAALGLSNYWGYNSINFFVPDARLMGGTGIQAFRDMVAAYHTAGIEVILDVVYNHTAESWELGPTLSFRGIDNASYYRLRDNKRYYKNETGCGNSLNLSHPRVLQMVMDSLRYWVTVMGVDGFRFDLAPTLARNPDEFDANGPFLAALMQDPVLAGAKLIAEPWDIGMGGYQLGRFPARFGEWNDRYRDTVRRFWRGDGGMLPDLGARLMGSADLFDHHGRAAHASVNFVTSHDGFTLADTVSYAHKHNDANGEQGRDGHGENHSANMGHEGPTDDPAIKAARQARKRAMIATLMLSQGTPMLLGGDELGHSQRGNNNAYCQDNDITWLNWDADPDFLAFTRDMIAFRRAHPVLSRPKFLHGLSESALGIQDISWVGADGYAMNAGAWHDAANRCLGLLLCGSAGDWCAPDGSPQQDDTLLIILNAADTAQAFTLPDLPGSTRWQKCLDTGARVPFATHKPHATGASIRLGAQSVTVFTCQFETGSNKVRQQLVSDLADLYGIEPGYHSFDGQYHPASYATRRALLAALGAPVADDTLLAAHLQDRRALKTGTQVITAGPGTPPVGRHTVMADGVETSLIVAPDQAHHDTSRLWGITAPLYGLRSGRNWGVGDFEDLVVLAEQAAQAGAAFVGVNPVHALFPEAPENYSPYSPSSRNFLNVMHIAPDMIPELKDTAAGQAHLAAVDLKAARAADLVDYAAVAALKRPAFELAFTLLPHNTDRLQAFESFLVTNGEPLWRHATFEALAEHFARTDHAAASQWQVWPPDYQDCNSPTVAAFATLHEQRIRFFAYLQWLAAGQLGAAQARAVTAGMRIGLYLDLAVGTVPGGSETWAAPDAVIRDVSLGAPGDTANPDGQNWTLAPFNPDALKRLAYAPFAAMIRSAMDKAGMIRIDHILGINRSFLCPTEPGVAGGYVRFPKDDLIGVIALESAQSRTLVIGEDLGTVPAGFRESLQSRKILGCRLALFERGEDGGLVPAADYPPHTLAALSNHDLPTVRGFWQGEDFIWRQALGIAAEPERVAADQARRARDRQNILNLLAAEELLPAGLDAANPPADMSPDLSHALHAFLARTASRLVAVQIEDILDLKNQPNVPGTSDEQPNWRRKLPVGVEHIFADAGTKRLFDALNKERPGH